MISYANLDKYTKKVTSGVENSEEAYGLQSFWNSSVWYSFKQIGVAVKHHSISCNTLDYEVLDNKFWYEFLQKHWGIFITLCVNC